MRKNYWEDRAIGVIDSKREREKMRREGRKAKMVQIAELLTPPSPREQMEALFNKKMAVGSMSYGDKR